MRCVDCGEIVTFVDGTYKCNCCNKSYTNDSLLKQTQDNKNKFIITKGVLTGYRGFDSVVVIPDEVTTIGQSAFKNNLTIRKVSFSDNTVVIENNAFEGCTNLVDISNYSKIQYFKSECFKGSGLEEIEICENVLAIEKNAFSYMPNLKKLVYYPGKNLNLDRAFSRSANLEFVQMDKKYFFPYLCLGILVKKNPSRNRPTYADAFAGTKYFEKITNELKQSYKKGICPDCGGHIKKGLFSAKCVSCGIVYKTIQ